MSDTKPDKKKPTYEQALELQEAMIDLLKKIEYNTRSLVTP